MTQLYPNKQNKKNPAVRQTVTLPDDLKSAQPTIPQDNRNDTYSNRDEKNEMQEEPDHKHFTSIPQKGGQDSRRKELNKSHHPLDKKDQNHKHHK